MYLSLLQRIWHRLLSLRSKRSIAAGVRPSVFGVLGIRESVGWGQPARKSTWYAMRCDDTRWIGGANGGRIWIDITLPYLILLLPAALYSRL